MCSFFQNFFKDSCCVASLHLAGALIPVVCGIGHIAYNSEQLVQALIDLSRLLPCLGVFLYGCVGQKQIRACHGIGQRLPQLLSSQCESPKLRLLIV